MMLAADARAEGAPGSGRAAMGREEIVTNLAPYLAQIKGNIQEVLPIKLMRNGETRTVLIAGRGPLRTRVGVAIVWMGECETLCVCAYETLCGCDCCSQPGS